ncbi:hypothetical protein [Novosphingobium fuchskuhlense]|nr:hypothetical protein [Novosphingobium fuchskuhlense]
MTYRPRNTNIPTLEAPKANKRWFDSRKPERSKTEPFGFHAERNDGA